MAGGATANAPTNTAAKGKLTRKLLISWSTPFFIAVSSGWPATPPTRTIELRSRLYVASR